MSPALTLAITLILALVCTSQLTHYLATYQLWTALLRISTIQHWFIVAATLAVPCLLSYELVFHLPSSLAPFTFLASLLIAACTALTLFAYTLPAYQSRAYLWLRWKAWTGPSRTGIAADLVRHVGTCHDWETLDTMAFGTRRTHPVEDYPFSSWRMRSLIAADPTDLLKARAANSDADKSMLPLASSPIKDGVFQPILPGRPASLLWGEHLGFARRCSRGIIAVPRELLGTWPTIAGIDGRGICLACGILARNKGLDPSSLICNLSAKRTLAAFEEHSVFWPRPAKTLRSLVSGEFERFFYLLGPAYIAVAPELALLLIDAPVEVAEDWLDGGMEHQDLALNNEAHALGAGPEDLDRLYRGHYAAMLVSLSAHRIGVRVRPEILVYEAVCRSEGVAPGPWAMSRGIQSRRQMEVDLLGPRVFHLVDAVV